MSINTWMLFSLTCFITTMIPGPSVLLGLNNGIVYGKRKSVSTALGVTAAATLMGTLSILGVGSILVASGKLFQILKYLGAVYLIYIGMKIWLDSSIINNQSSTAVSKVPARTLFYKSFMVGISNPKAIVFFTALFPQFLNSDTSNIKDLFILNLTLSAVVFLCMMIYIFCGQILAPIIKKRTCRSFINKITGGIIISFGAGLALTE